MTLPTTYSVAATLLAAGVAFGLAPAAGAQVDAMTSGEICASLNDNGTVSLASYSATRMTMKNLGYTMPMQAQSLHDAVHFVCPELEAAAYEADRLWQPAP
ncbi:hypothetical protein [Mycolicibacterium sp. S3B2]|uniref:hypothetical protein n=1 Tax=Mycolicibacterium sp. S3B2 TaxID=3415120 RepID=UPI003C7DCB51